MCLSIYIEFLLFFYRKNLDFFLSLFSISISVQDLLLKENEMKMIKGCVILPYRYSVKLNSQERQGIMIEKGLS